MSPRHTDSGGTGGIRALYWLGQAGFYLGCSLAMAACTAVVVLG